jgi:hypothetical protein
MLIIDPLIEVYKLSLFTFALGIILDNTISSKTIIKINSYSVY